LVQSLPNIKGFLMSEHNTSEEGSQQLADELLAEYLRRIEAGEAVDREEFLRLHPEAAGPLCAYFAGADSMRRLMAQSGSGNSAEQQNAGPSAVPSMRGDETIAPRGQMDSASGFAGRFSILPTQFGRYRVEKLLGTGAMGAVYLAHDMQLTRSVALKVPRIPGDEDSEIVSRLLREAKAAANLNHPNICRIYDAGVEAGTFYIAMEYIDGRMLSDFISPDRLQDERRSVNVVRKLAAAMAEAHAKGIIHRDLKPANILVNARGEPILTDFGLARLTDQPRDGRATQSGMLIGSPAYMSPEQANGDTDKIGPRSDIYSLGVVLFELLTSRLPFQGSVLTILSQIMSKEPPPPSSLRPGLDPRLDFICQRLMAKSPDDRFASMTEVGQELQNWLKAAPLIVHPATGGAPATAGLKATTEPAATAKKVDPANSADIVQQERRVRKLLDEQNYDAAIPMLAKLSELDGSLFNDTVEWARTILPATKLKQQKLRERVMATYSKARTLMETYNYGEVAQMLDGIPAGARTDEVRQLLSLAGERFEECLGLQQEIDTAVRAKNYDRLLPLVRRFLKLKPDNAKMRKLADNLARNRPDRAVRNYKGTGNYFDVAGRLVEPKEIVAAFCLIVALFFGASYGAKYLGKIPTADELLASRPASNQEVDQPGKEAKVAAPVAAPADDAAIQPKTTATAWAWSFNRIQGGRVPESSETGLDLVLPKTAPADASLAAMIQGNTAIFHAGQTIEVDGVGDFDWKQPFTVGSWIYPQSNHRGAFLAKTFEARPAAGYSIEYFQGQFVGALIRDWWGTPTGGPAAIQNVTFKSYPEKQWYHVLMTYDGSGKASGLKIIVNGENSPLEERFDALDGSIKTAAKLSFGGRTGGLYFDGAIAEPRIYSRALTLEDALMEFQKVPRPNASGVASQ
jgi:serine/threonine protein kinase